MVDLGARPVIYLDDDATSTIISLHHRRSEEGMPQEVNDLVGQMAPLVFPLLEGKTQQGFMWEREWRLPDPDGLVFPHSAISIICCPEAEEDAIREALGDAAAGIAFVRVWEEYDAVTAFLREHQQELAPPPDTAAPEVSREEAVRLEGMIRVRRSALTRLGDFERVGASIQESVAAVADDRQRLEEEALELEAALERLTEAARAEALNAGAEREDS